MGHDTLKLLIEAIEESAPYLLASPEDAAFFRQTVKKDILKKEKAETLSFVPSPPPPTPPKPIVIPPKTVQPVQNCSLSLPSKSPIAESKPVRKNSEPIREFSLEPKAPLDFSFLHKLLSRAAPDFAIFNDIPSDATARKIAERWKTKNQTAPLSILIFQEPPEQRALLEEIALALDIYFIPAKTVDAAKIEKENQWDAFLSVADLKMVIVCDYTLWQLSGLMHFYKETPAQGSRALGSVPLFLLPDLSLYLKDPLLKRSLWKALCQKFS